MLAGSGTTLKYFFKSGNQVRLEAANQNYEPIILNAEDVSIQGKLSCLEKSLIYLEFS